MELGHEAIVWPDDRPKTLDEVEGLGESPIHLVDQVGYDDGGTP